MRLLRALRARFASLTSRLVITAVALVALVSILLGTVTALAMQSYLTTQLDTEVIKSLERAELAPSLRPTAQANGLLGDRPGRNGAPPDVRGQGVGTLTAFFLAEDQAGFGDIIVDGENGRTNRRVLDTEALAVLDELPTDGEVRAVSIPGAGAYRVAASSDGATEKVVTGLPVGGVDDAVDSLIVVEVLLGAFGVLLAGGIGSVVVRRQLRPLREVARTAHNVASMPLASGEVALSERVPGHLTDERTEVGQVGSALNNLLAHVETSLSARHRSEQQVRQFVADASHELRTPLTTIAGYTELARRRPDDTETARTALAKVEEESGRMTALVEDLLLLARLDAGRPLASAPVDLTRLLLEAVEDARVVAPEHRWALELGEEPVEVTGDEQRLHQVVTNLLTNARKYTPPGTQIRVGVRPDGFSVHDNGPGFPAELLDGEGGSPPAFERFARGDFSRNRAGGVGLGLSLVQAIVSAHRGTVTLTSRPGHTTISVALPS